MNNLDDSKPRWLMGHAESSSSRQFNFAIDSLLKIGYSSAAPQGVNGKRYLKNSSQQLATSISQIKTKGKGLRPSADWVWDWDWVTQGSRLGHAWETQASRKGHPWVELNKWFCLQQKLKNGGWLKESGHREIG